MTTENVIALRREQPSPSLECLELLGGGRELKVTLRDPAGGCVALLYRLQGGSGRHELAARGVGRFARRDGGDRVLTATSGSSFPPGF
jgi:hypothetical protein